MKYFSIFLLTVFFSMGAVADFGKLYFRGYECTDDCAGHLAGYNWAIQSALSSPDQCSGHSTSFIEGCVSVFAEGRPRNVTLVNSKKSKNYSLACIGSNGYGGPCYDGYGGPLYDGYGGPLYDGYGGNCYNGYGGNCYDGYGADLSKCPVLCR